MKLQEVYSRKESWLLRDVRLQQSNMVYALWLTYVYCTVMGVLYVY